ncbi:MAG TPA: DNA translocase FtsK [Candidatus Dojkabacteria bacterium]|nr:DNA translocase FtsK [Candidatus Dojkabacteria bacterium]
MARKKKSEIKDINIHSDETKIFFGLILAILGIGTLISPFFDAQLFRFITEVFGFASIPLGLTLIYLSLRFLTKFERLASWKIQIGLLIFTVAFGDFLTFWIPDEDIQTMHDFSTIAGSAGALMHIQLASFMGKFLEFVLIIILFVVAVSLITDVKLSQIRDFLTNLFKGEDSEESILKEMERELSSDKEVNVNMVGNNSESKDIDVQDEEEEKKDPQITMKMNSHKAPDLSKETEKDDKPKYTNWVFPSLELLQEPQVVEQDQNIYKKNALIIKQTLKSFGVEGSVVEISVGPTVVQYALSISVGTRVAKVNNLAHDLALALAVQSSSIRIETPIPGTSYIGIETPNPMPNYVYAKDMINQLKKEKDKYQLPLLLGKDVSGKYIIGDLTKMPHLLVAGATGTGKSVGINSILLGMLMTKTPDEVRFILVDPKMVEMAPYNGIPHLLHNVITDMELVVSALQWATEEMTRRYMLFKQVGVRNVKEYNATMGFNSMQYIVIVIDEMADLMLQTGVDVETKIVRLAQMARATGIHLILATQRPSVNVITGLIKANIPARIAFSVATAIDSRVIIDQVGAETLIGNGDMLFKSPSLPKPLRIQGTYTDIKDLDKIIKHIKAQAGDIQYNDDVINTKVEIKGKVTGGGDNGADDEMFKDALDVVINAQKASSSLLQRKLRIGYNRAARLIDELEDAGAIGPSDGSNARKVLVTSPSQILGEQE